MPQISAYGTRVEATCANWSHIHDLQLADPEFMKGDAVELLLGADVHSAIVEEGLRKGGPRTPIAQQTSLDWILSGVVDDAVLSNSSSTHFCQMNAEITELVRRFWSQEEPLSAPVPLTDEDQMCEDLFVSSHSRTPEGRYIVRLPVKSTLPKLYEMRRATVRLLQCMKSRFTINHDFQRLYRNFMAEYVDLGHITASSSPLEHEQRRVCYLPHHGVVKGSTSSGKIRVVFNGSSRLADGDCFNAHLATGSNLLPALSDVLLRWRQHRFSLAADVEKMYCQILVHQYDRDLQRILWRPETSGDLQEFRLNTVTYGLACAPFLAMRTLRQLAADEEIRFPHAAVVIQRDTYVDVLTGADTLDEAQVLRDELTGLCAAGGFPLRKWAANSDAVLTDIPLEHRQVQDPRAWDADVEHSTLGLLWHPRQDYFAFQVQPLDAGQVTKRIVLSQTARPMGWLSPVIIAAKILIQTLWLQQLEWDQPVSLTEERVWQRLRDELSLVEQVCISRWIQISTAGGHAEVHGFADASERAYAAAVYFRVADQEGRRHSFLLQAKTKVAPVRPVSLPRLELCPAALLAKLTIHVTTAIKLTSVPFHLWTDSTVTLAWIEDHPSRWKIYVANRVADIQRTLPEARWHHISGNSNPADCALRGFSPKDLVEHSFWWSGPTWLTEEAECPFKEDFPSPPSPLPDERSQIHATTVDPKEDQGTPLLQRFSKLHRLLRVTAWCCRWLEAIRTRHTSSFSGTPLTPQEIEEARRRWIRCVQSRWFRVETLALSKGGSLPKRSLLVKLIPFKDEHGIIRVGGQLKHAVLNSDERHLILPRGSHFTMLVIEACHQKTLHGGVQLILRQLRQRYWVPGGRLEIRRLIQRCIPYV